MGSSLGNVPAVRERDPKGSRNIDGLYPGLEEIVRAGDAARGLLASDGWRVLMTLVEAEIATIDRLLDSDRLLESRADYAFRHGRRGALRFPEQALRALIGRADARYEEQRAKHEGGAESSPGGG